MIDFKAIKGDPSDNIPGVPGIGGKTATMLLQSFDSLEGVYNRLAGVIEEAGLISKSEFLISNKIPNLNDQILKTLSKIIEIKPAALKALIENREKAFLSQRLATIRRDVPIDFKLEDTAWGDFDKVKDFFNRMQFHSLLRRFGAERGEEPKTKESAEQKKKDEQLKLL